MTGSELYTLFTELVEDSPSDAWFYSVLNACKDALEAERPWAYLRKIDSSNTRLSSDTWQTAKTLPSDFAYPTGITVGTDRTKYEFVPFDRIDMKDTDGTVRLDMANDSFYFNGTAGTTGTAYLQYQKFTDAVTSSTSPEFPARFHQLLAYDVAKQWFAKDQSERGLAWDKEHYGEYARLKTAMERWDDQIRLAESNSVSTVSVWGLDLT